MLEKVRNRLPRSAILALAATLALTSGCDVEYEPLPEESTSQTPPPPSTAPCNTPEAATPYPIESDTPDESYKNTLVGVVGLREYKAAWDNVQKLAEDNLQAKRVPLHARVKFSATVGIMMGYDETREAAGIEINGVGIGGATSEGELTDSSVYEFVRDPEDPKPEPGASLDRVVLTFTPEIELVGCR